MPSARLLKLLQSLFKKGWDISVIENESQDMTLVLSYKGEVFTIKQTYPDLNLRDWLANEVEKPASGLGALFG